jgi:hypothetical protein
MRMVGYEYMIGTVGGGWRTRFGILTFLFEFACVMNAMISTDL